MEEANLGGFFAEEDEEDLNDHEEAKEEAKVEEENEGADVADVIPEHKVNHEGVRETEEVKIENENIENLNEQKTNKVMLDNPDAAAV